jgi:hypothetical protein
VRVPSRFEVATVSYLFGTGTEGRQAWRRAGCGKASRTSVPSIKIVTKTNRKETYHDDRTSILDSDAAESAIRMVELARKCRALWTYWE